MIPYNELEERAAESLQRAMTLFIFVAVCNWMGRKPIQVLAHLGNVLSTSAQANQPIQKARAISNAYSTVVSNLTSHILRAQLSAVEQIEENISDQ